jgi:hypothetical protein
MNPFQLGFDSRLREWKNLRIIIRGESLDKACVHVDKWWQQVPLINHHLHPNDLENWPDPWTMLSDNLYCTLTRAVGICYTLLMSDINDVNLFAVVNEHNEEHNLVVVGNAKYVLNYYPDSVLSTNLQNFKITKTFSLDILQQQIN